MSDEVKDVNTAPETSAGGGQTPEVQPKESGTSEHVPYDRFAEVNAAKKAMEEELRFYREREQMSKMANQSSTPEYDADLLDPEMKKYVDSNFKNRETQLLEAIGNLQYEVHKQNLINKNPALAEHASEIDNFCVNYRKKYGVGIGVEEAAQLILAKKELEKVKKATASAPTQTQTTEANPAQTTTTAQVPPMPTGGGSATSDKAKEYYDKLDDVEL